MHIRTFPPAFIIGAIIKVEIILILSLQISHLIDFVLISICSLVQFYSHVHSALIVSLT